MNANTKPIETNDSVKRDPENDGDSISFQLQRARVDAGLSIVELSKQTGISKTVLHGYERGRTKPGAREIRLLCSTLNVSPNRLILGSDDFELNPSTFTSFYRKVRARPELAGLFYTMCMPLMASLLDEDEVRSLLFIVASLVKTRSPEFSDQLMLAAQEAMTTLDNITLADGAITITEGEMHTLITETHERFKSRMEQKK